MKKYPQLSDADQTAYDAMPIPYPGPRGCVNTGGDGYLCKCDPCNSLRVARIAKKIHDSEPPEIKDEVTPRIMIGLLIFFFLMLLAYGSLGGLLLMGFVKLLI